MPTFYGAECRPYVIGYPARRLTSLLLTQGGHFEIGPVDRSRSVFDWR